MISRKTIIRPRGPYLVIMRMRLPVSGFHTAWAICDSVGLDVQQLLDDDLDAAVLRLTYTRTRWHQQMRVAEALDSDGACRHAIFDQFGLHGLGTPYR